MSMTPREQLASATMIATHEIVLDLEKAKSAFESLVNGVQDFTCLITCEGRVVWGNLEASSWMACDRDVLHEQTLHPLFQELHWHLFVSFVQPFTELGLSGGTVEFQLPILKAGQLRDILWSVRPFQAVSVRRGTILLLVGRDITDVLAERSERTKLEAELETAQIMQAAFFPSKHIVLPHIEISAFYRPAEQCSGDWWGHFSLGDGLDLVCIADVTGHGAASALVTAMTQATCMTFVSQAREASRIDFEKFPSQLINQINRVVYESFHGKFFMTFFAILFDTRERVIRACNAGHNFPLIIPGVFRQQAQSAAIGETDTKPLRGMDALAIQGNPIGFDPHSTFVERVLPLHPMDRFLMFTDGIIECRNEAGQMYGSSRLRRAMMKYSDKPALEFRDAIVESALDHYGSQALSDDLTLVVIDINWQL